MSWDINKAEVYFLVPFKDQKSLFMIGDEKRLLNLQIVMDESLVVATAGVNLEECYIIVNLTGEECQEILEKANKNAQSRPQDEK